MALRFFRSPVGLFIGGLGLFSLGMLAGAAGSTDYDYGMAPFFEGITAVGTVLLGIAAILGVSEWSRQQRQLKQSERAEAAIEALIPIESHINKCENCKDSLKALIGMYEETPLDKWKSYFKSNSSTLNRLYSSLDAEFTAAKKYMFWFESPELEIEIEKLQSSLNELYLTLNIFSLNSYIDDFDLSLPKNQSTADREVRNLIECIPHLRGSYNPIKRRLVNIANLDQRGF